MADSKSAEDGFDLKRFQELVELMEKYDLREVRLKKGSEKWYLRRGPQEIISAAPAASPPPVMVPPAAPAPAAPTAPAPASAGRDEGTVEIKSPMVGTFYRASSPEDPPFVKEGDRVHADTVVCLIEAMKFFNQVKAECSGTIVKVLCKDGDAVEFGQPLFLVQPE